ncbi:c-type cytochrome [Inquilinus sp. Marseille-Q2685]|uniref:cytochrome c oxidase subunit II n=1 Tax=Inquilinus sp. Marseille-Q2685 TaxID=2866581 RepID=UPI001CE460CC|nr:c-type cytochrome [Inquilinus sp. Marseille-Q2685]
MRRRAIPAGAAPPGGCAGVQSALVPRGTEAQEIDALFWTVTAISAAVTVLVLVVTAVALRGPGGWRRVLATDRIVVGGGIVLPVVVLSALLVYGLLVMQAGAARSRSAEGPGVTITGKRWWWQVVYQDRDGREIVSANELRLPVGRPVAVRLETDDVIHSFWAPQLGGKLDMIPGRSNTLTLEATEAGVSRAQCAEYCGGAHALMSMHVVALEPDAYDSWLAAEAAPAREPALEPARRGRDLFLRNGCGACHAVRGTEAGGTIGPDLTHVGGRLSLGAAALPNDAEAFARWIADNQHVKPGNLMPPYHSLSPDDLAAIAAYLEGLD